MALTKEDLSAIAQLMDVRFDKVENRLDRVESSIDKVEGRLGRVENRLDRVESEVSALKVGQVEIRKDITRLEKRMEDIYGNVVDNWASVREAEVRIAKLEKKAG